MRTVVATAIASQLREAREHERVARVRRAVSHALRAGEARACWASSDGDRDTSPFAHREDIVGVSPSGAAREVRARADALQR